jgi:hypothetical protein
MANSWEEAGDVAKYSIMHRTSLPPPPRIIWSQMLIMPRLRNSYQEGVINVALFHPKGYFKNIRHDNE